MKRKPAAKKPNVTDRADSPEPGPEMLVGTTEMSETDVNAILAMGEENSRRPAPTSDDAPPAEAAGGGDFELLDTTDGTTLRRVRTHVVTQGVKRERDDAETLAAEKGKDEAVATPEPEYKWPDTGGAPTGAQVIIGYQGRHMWVVLAPAGHTLKAFGTEPSMTTAQYEAAIEASGANVITMMMDDPRLRVIELRDPDSPDVYDIMAKASLGGGGGGGYEAPVTSLPIKKRGVDSHRGEYEMPAWAAQAAYGSQRAYGGGSISIGGVKTEIPALVANDPGASLGAVPRPFPVSVYDADF